MYPPRLFFRRLVGENRRTTHSSAGSPGCTAFAEGSSSGLLLGSHPSASNDDALRGQAARTGSISETLVFEEGDRPPRKRWFFMFFLGIDDFDERVLMEKSFLKADHRTFQIIPVIHRCRRISASFVAGFHAAPSHAIPDGAERRFHLYVIGEESQRFSQGVFSVV